MDEGETTEIHGFCDASLHAYAAVIYTKTSGSDNIPRISLLTARTKVAPLKGATIPRLELCAAHLLAIMLQNVRLALGLMSTPFYLWSDSRIVLCWLRKEPVTLKPFVANRVKQIQNIAPSKYWNHVRSAANPADCASRGMNASDLLQHQLWWCGPTWLKDFPRQPEQEYAESLLQEELNAVQIEQKVASLTTAVSKIHGLTTRRRDGLVISLTDQFSSLQRLLHTVATILRWTIKWRHKRGSPVVDALELEDALKALIRLEQEAAFSLDIHQLRHRSTLPTTSRLMPLNPFLDEFGILRVGGRIGRAALPHDQRFPMILPKDSALVWLLVNKTHRDTLHGGTQLMLQTLRSRFWILNGRQVVRSFVHNCVICRRHRGTLLKQQMASLPHPRINASRPFLSSGVDYCGPFTVRVGAKRSRTTVKSYLAIFICMVTKAVHIEVVDDLSSQSFLDAFTRFISRRGPCRDLFSDNGTAFVGANRMLQEDLEALQNEQTQQALANIGTNWHFITPGAPHQGGLWEAAVKSAKRHLVRLVGGQVLWYNQLHTLATRIEACLNSRPLTPLHDDPDDKFALTPGDFLIGAPLIAVPEPNITEIPLNRVKHWQWLRHIHQSFWQRWSEEYLATLQTRSKWQQRSENIRVGDIVLVRQDNLPPTNWRLGRVVEVYPGSDGLVRNATVKTAVGVFKRAVQKLCRLVDSDGFEPGGSTGQDV